MARGEILMHKGDMGREMYVVVRGEVEVMDEHDGVVKTLKDGDVVGEIAMLIHTPRTATVRAKTNCDLMALDKASFSRILRDHPQFADSITRVAKERYNLEILLETLLGEAPRA